MTKTILSIKLAEDVFYCANTIGRMITGVDNLSASEHTVKLPFRLSKPVKAYVHKIDRPESTKTTYEAFLVKSSSGEIMTADTIEIHLDGELSKSVAEKIVSRTNDVLSILRLAHVPFTIEANVSYSVLDKFKLAQAI